MRSFFVFAVALVATCSADTYSTEHDNLDIEAVVADVNTLQAYVDCFTNKGDCDTVTASFKKDLAEAIEQACSKCTDAQKHITKVFFEGLKQKLPTANQALRKIYDPDNKYFDALEEAVAKY